jgi:glucan 1,4-alpha-glucosidase
LKKDRTKQNFSLLFAYTVNFECILKSDHFMPVKKIVLSLLAATCLLAAASAQTITLSSPGKTVALVFSVNGGAATYSMSYKNRAVIKPSNLGFNIKGSAPLSNDFEISGIDSAAVNESWNPVWGEVKTIRNQYKELRVQLKEKAAPQRALTVVFKVYDEGLGFRYEFPKQKVLDNFIVAEELTQFALTGNHKAFWLPGDYDTNEFPPNTSKLSEVDAASSRFSQEIYAKTFFDKNAVQTPLMMKTDDGLYINLHEAALVNYPAMNLVIDKSNYVLNAHLVPDAVGNKAYLQTPAQTPWRTIIVSDKATEILASKMILNLNDPSKIADPSWIKPVKYVGIWWEMHVGKSTWDYAGSQDMNSATGLKPHGRHGATTERTKRYIDFAATHGFDGVLVEGWNTGWEDWFGKWKEEVFDFVTPYPDYDIAFLTKYAQSKGVKLIMHHETSGSVSSYERHMDTAYRFMRNMGINAVKTGYVGPIIPRGEHHDGQWMINHYLRVASKTASYKIMLDAHEPVRPTGLHRTYPNWLASEAARGNEFNAWSSGNKPEHETILPFTRLMGGPMDYTPGIFQIKLDVYGDPNKKEQVHTTLAKQLALYVTLYSPLQMAADLPENYESRLDAFQFIKDVAVDWDDTKILEAEPGDYLTIARKAKGRDTWFIGSITDENRRMTNIPLNFLDNNRKYVVTIYADAPDASWDKNPSAYVISKSIVTSKTVLKLSLAESGGAAISIAPASGFDEKQYKKYK